MSDTSDTLKLARPWAGHPAGTVLGTAAAGEGIAAVVDELRLQTLREHGYDEELEAAIEEPKAASPKRRKVAQHGS